MPLSTLGPCLVILMLILTKGPGRYWPLWCLHVEAMIMIKCDANTFIAALMPGLQPLCGLFRQPASQHHTNHPNPVQSVNTTMKYV